MTAATPVHAGTTDREQQAAGQEQVHERSRGRQRAVQILLLAHIAALAFGLGGLLIALPNPDLWAGKRYAADVYDFGMNYGGALHIILGAAVMIVFGGRAIGWGRTLTFFFVAVVLSLSSELIGTGTGWPFGNYEYTEGLGYKVLGRVPFTIPLSWFYVGFASYLLFNRLLQGRAGRWQGLGAVIGGAYLLTVWDLVLDPAMAHEDLYVQFWTWFETGAYFGMPIKNFAGWTFTALVFMGVSRLLWRNDPDARTHSATVPYVVFIVNMIFAAALSLSVDLWEPVVLGIALGVIPATIAWRHRPLAPVGATDVDAALDDPTTDGEGTRRWGSRPAVAD